MTAPVDDTPDEECFCEFYDDADRPCLMCRDKAMEDQ